MLSGGISAGTSYARAATVDRQNAPLRQHRCVCHVQRAPLAGPSTVGAPRTDSLCGSGQLDKSEATEFGLLHIPPFVHQKHFMYLVCCCSLSYVQVSSLVIAPPGVAAAKFPEHLRDTGALPPHLTHVILRPLALLLLSISRCVRHSRCNPAAALVGSGAAATLGHRRSGCPAGAGRLHLAGPSRQRECSGLGTQPPQLPPCGRPRPRGAEPRTCEKASVFYPTAICQLQLAWQFSVYLPHTCLAQQVAYTFYIGTCEGATGVSAGPN